MEWIQRPLANSLQAYSVISVIVIYGKKIYILLMESVDIVKMCLQQQSTT